jgi:hypothetical protein
MRPIASAAGLVILFGACWAKGKALPPQAAEHGYVMSVMRDNFTNNNSRCVAQMQLQPSL